MIIIVVFLKKINKHFKCNYIVTCTEKMYYVKNDNKP